MDNAFGQPFPDKPAVRLGRGTINDIAYSPDGRLLAISRGQQNALDEFVVNIIQLWDVASQQLLGTLETQGSIFWGARSLAFSLDGQLLASAEKLEGVSFIELWDVHTKYLRLVSDAAE